jgi:hypothetical protein
MITYNRARKEKKHPGATFRGRVLRQREEWIRFSYSNEDTKDGEEERAGSSTDGQIWCQAPSPRPVVIPRAVAIGLGGSGNRPGQWQDPWKYLAASSPHRKFNQVLRPESHCPRTTPQHRDSKFSSIRKTAYGARIGFPLSCDSPSLPSSAFFILWSLQVRAHSGSAYFYC